MSTASPAPPPPTVVDSLGKACPIPIIDLAKAIVGVPVGGEVMVLADEPGAKVDIPVWCRMKRHEFVGMEPAERGWAFRVRRLA
jgi:cysteine desulfurase